MTFFNRRYNRPGTAPGTLERVSAERPPVRLAVIDYSVDDIVEHDNPTMDECRALLDSPNITWLHVQGQPDEELLNAIGNIYGLHPLALEDVTNVGQRTKIESYDEHSFIIMTLPIADDDGVRSQQVSLFLGQRYVVSFHEGRDDVFEAVRKRLRAAEVRRIRRLGADYLLYALLDTIVDHGFPILERFGDRLETLEEAVLENPARETLDNLHWVKRELLLLRRILWPEREVINSLIRDEHAYVSDETRVFMRDCYDHTIQIIELVESYRELAASVTDLYMSSVSNRMNDVMKVLTIIATIFIPLSFIVGLYGMNFDTELSPWNMPELGTYYGYPVLWLVLLGIAGGMLWLFHRNDWF